MLFKSGLMTPCRRVSVYFILKRPVETQMEQQHFSCLFIFGAELHKYNLFHSNKYNYSNSKQIQMIFLSRKSYCFFKKSHSFTAFRCGRLSFGCSSCSQLLMHNIWLLWSPPKKGNWIVDSSLLKLSALKPSSFKSS